MEMQVNLKTELNIWSTIETASYKITSYKDSKDYYYTCLQICLITFCYRTQLEGEIQIGF